MDYQNYSWSEQPQNPNNLIPRTIELHAKKKRFFIQESMAPEGMPISEITYDNDTTGRGVVFEGNTPLNLIFVTLFRNSRLAPMRFRETKPGSGQVRPFSYIPVFFEGSSQLYKLGVNGAMVNELNGTIEQFYQKIVHPHLKNNPDAPREIFNFSIPILLNRRVACKESHIYAPDLNFTGKFEDYYLGTQDAEAVRKFLEDEGLPFIRAQEKARVEEAQRKFGPSNFRQPVAGAEPAQAESIPF